MTLRDETVLLIRSAAPTQSEQPTDRLDRWLADQVAALPDAPDLSRSRIKALLLEGCVSVSGVTVTDPSTPVKPDRNYRIRVPAPTSASPRPEATALDIVHEDADLIVIDKPAGMVVHPAPGTPDHTLVNALLHHCGDSLSGIGGVRRPGIVHRLDKDTTGVMVIAKNDETHHALTHQFAARTVQRTYVALVWGVPDRAEGRIEGDIGRSQRNRKKMAVTQRGGRSAATRFRVIARYHGIASLIECRLESGRTHQIRVHMSHIGHSIIGDTLYGSGDRRRGAIEDEIAAARALGRQALHANFLEFEHPARRERVAFSRDMPPTMRQLVTIFAKSGQKS